MKNIEWVVLNTDPLMQKIVGDLSKYQDVHVVHTLQEADELYAKICPLYILFILPSAAISEFEATKRLQALKTTHPVFVVEVLSRNAEGEQSSISGKGVDFSIPTDFSEDVVEKIRELSTLYQLQLLSNNIVFDCQNTEKNLCLVDEFPQRVQRLGEMLNCQQLLLFQNDKQDDVNKIAHWKQPSDTLQTDEVLELFFRALKQKHILRSSMLLMAVEDLPSLHLDIKVDELSESLTHICVMPLQDSQGVALGWLLGALDSSSVPISTVLKCQLQYVLTAWSTLWVLRLKNQASRNEMAYRCLVSDIAQEFIQISPDGYDKAIQKALFRIGGFFEVDRISYCVYDFELNTVKLTHQWYPTSDAENDVFEQCIPDPEKNYWVSIHKKGMPVILNNLDERNPQKKDLLFNYHQAKSLIAVPMMDQQVCLGYICIERIQRKKHYFDLDQQALLYVFADILVNAQQKILLEEKLNLTASVFEWANQGIMIADSTGSIIDVNQAFSDITGYERYEVIGKKPSILKSGHHDNRFYQQLWKSLLTEKKWTGEIWNRRKNGEVFAELQTISAITDKQGKIKKFISLFSDISSQKQHQKELERIAHFDSLTGLVNRVTLNDRIAHAMSRCARKKDYIAIVYLDLDGFKEVNDSLGHEVGDKLLVYIARKMQDMLRKEDTLARLGGDEFVAVFCDLPTFNACIPLLERLLKAVSTPVDIDGEVIKVSASIGVVCYASTDEIEAEQLIRHADQAMYRAKMLGKNRFVIYDNQQEGQEAIKRQRLERFALAIERQELVLHYQPKVNMRTGSIIGVEALVRWQHPEQGLLYPGDFLPELNNNQLMIKLGDWVINAALSQISEWKRQGAPLRISINIDTLQLEQPEFVNNLRRAIIQYPDVDASDLVLEVVEKIALKDILVVSELFENCSNLGVGLSLDDFGTGYSSLSHLKKLPIHQIKMDQSFVRDMLVDQDDCNFLAGIVGLAETFHRQVIAEGVETEEHGVRLLELGCELGQGDAIARPMPADQIKEWSLNWHPAESWTHKVL